MTQAGPDRREDSPDPTQWRPLGAVGQQVRPASASPASDGPRQRICRGPQTVRSQFAHELCSITETLCRYPCEPLKPVAWSRRPARANVSGRKVHKMCTSEAAPTTVLSHSSIMSFGTDRPRGQSFEDVVTELLRIRGELQDSLYSGRLSDEARHHLRDALRKIELAAQLLNPTARFQGGFDVENPVRRLPNCSRSWCERAAGAIVSGAMFCGEHANEALRNRP